MSIRLKTESQDALMLRVTTVAEAVTDVEIEVHFPEAIVPETMKIQWYTKAGGSCMEWNPMDVYDHSIHPCWSKATAWSRSASGMPMQCYFSSWGENVVTVSVMDVQMPLEIKSGLVEETGELEWELRLFTARTEEMQAYHTVLRIDERRIPYEAVIKETVARWQADALAKYNPSAFEPVYSTWYSYHQQVTPELLYEIQEAAKLGMKTVIVDDGWQTDDNSRGYAYCGDWRIAESKIPDMRSFVEKVHEAGMKIMLWYSVPFVGVHSQAWEKYKEQFLYDNSGECGALDPRYPKVREHLISVYEQAVREWDLDGLKLDFIDSFSLNEKSKISHEEMDMLSLEQAVCTLLAQIYERLRTIKPDILIEFRQSYVGPAMLASGNMMRAADCPMDALQNRIRTVNLRLTSGKTAVHSDMLMWDYEDSAESAANQFINILFSVPQISMRLNELSKEHYAMLAFYLKLWRKHRKTITEGELHALHPEANYTLVYTEKDNSMVAAAYSDKLLCPDENIRDLVFVNGTGTDVLYLETERERYQYHIYDCMGRLAESGSAKKGLKKLAVPAAGVVTVEF